MEAAPAPSAAGNAARVEAFWNKFDTQLSGRPSLGQLGRRKLFTAGRSGVYVAVITLLLNKLLHRTLRIPKGTIRAKVQRVLAKALLVPSTTAVVICAAIASLVTWRRRKLTSFETAIESLGQGLHSWAQTSEHLRTFSDKQIGWLVAEAPASLLERTHDLTAEFRSRMRKLRRSSRRRDRLAWRMGLGGAPQLTRKKLLDALGSPRCVGGWDGLSVLLVPGLLTTNYPKYFAVIVDDLERLGIDVEVSAIDTGASVEQNARVLCEEVNMLTRRSQQERRVAGKHSEDSTTDHDCNPPPRFGSPHVRKVALYGHSKGAIDAAAALAIYPEMRENVAAFVSAQGPHGGSWVANDLDNTWLQKALASFGVEKLLGGSKDAVFDMTYAKRREFYMQHPQPVWTEVPSICLATCGTRLPSALLSPIVEYMRYRYGEDLGLCDGLVAVRDAVLPGCGVVRLQDMDHCGPAWSRFPANDRYDATQMCLSLITMALDSDVIADMK